MFRFLFRLCHWHPAVSAVIPAHVDGIVDDSHYETGSWTIKNPQLLAVKGFGVVGAHRFELWTR